MKAGESGMLDKQTWDQFFDPNSILSGLGICSLTGTIGDMGCRHGTFTIPAAQRPQVKTMEKPACLAVTRSGAHRQADSLPELSRPDFPLVVWQSPGPNPCHP